MILLAISFIAGILSALAPCVLPLLPVIVGGSIAGGSRRRAYTITASLGISVILFTMLLKVSTAFIDVPQSTWQLISGIILVFFGVVMIFPQLWDRLGFVNFLNRESNKLLGAGYRQNSFWGDVVMGAALGPVFSSCSPTYFVILATVLPVSFAMGFVDLVAYAVGLSGTLLLIALVGQRLVDTLGVTIEPGGWFRRAIGILFLIVGIAVATGTMARAEAWLLNNGFDITVLEQRLLKSTAPTPTQCTTSECVGVLNAPLSPEMKVAVFKKAPELTGIEGYINTNGEPITLEQLRGNKVVLIDIWTYSCINCQRTLPYLRAWYEKYHDQGLEIIGVHTPEFAFERVLANVQQAVQKFGLEYPVVLDNKYATWNAFGNQYWPRKYLIDIDGYIVYDHTGEGGYEETEVAIERALNERAKRLGESMPSEFEETSVDAVEVDRYGLGSPEIYFGAARNEYFANGSRGRIGEQSLTVPEDLKQNALYLGGTWNLAEEFAANTSAQAQIQFVYKAKNVYFVAAPTNGPVKIKVTRDGGQPLGEARGVDVEENGEVTVSEDGLYHLIGDSAYGVHTIEIEILSPGLEAYTFTFG
ncbi:cytochrome c biogenesis protein DipZ [Candidatus Parcubacteria bacterium]|nr:MAG: cytochrome c biogenesis protein DipZ [Candidatus Parcubacteria bacterium]